jgi:hypothetical protein
MMAKSGRWDWAFGITLAVAATLLVASCKTTPNESPDEVAAPASAEFVPLSAVVSIEQGQGQYPQLFSPDSFAVWVTPEVTALKRREAAKEGTVEPWLDDNARIVPSDYIVLECHVNSAFGDQSVAYDAVALRGFDAYLEVPTADGVRRVEPAQTLVDPTLDEGQQGALKAFSRTNLLIFPRVDFLRGSTTVPSDASAVKLVLDGVQSQFTFTWASAAGQPSEPLGEKAVQAAQLGFRELYSRLSQLAHMFD